MTFESRARKIIQNLNFLLTHFQAVLELHDDATHRASKRYFNSPRRKKETDDQKRFFFLFDEDNYIIDKSHEQRNALTGHAISMGIKAFTQ